MNSISHAMKTKNATFIQLSIVVSLLNLCSCGSTVKMTRYLQEPGAKIADYKTYNFHDVQAQGTIPAEYKHRIDLIQQEFAKYMESLGLTRNTQNPDLLINIGLVVEEKIQTRETDFRTDRPLYTGQRNYSWQSETVEVARYHEGTVTMDWVDRAKDKRMWEFVLTSIMVKKDEASLKNIQKGKELISEKLRAGN
jgi:hypothetical protein